MSRRPPVLLLLFLLPAVLASKPPATPPELVDFDWRGEDVVLVFSDSVGYEVDLAGSDTSQVVVRFRSLAIAETLRQRAAGAEAPVGGVAISLGGRDGRAAALAQRGAEASLRIHDDERLGYSIEWRPYTRQLVVHTFEWDRLGYAESQFHQGLIALEQNVADQAEELLQVANASGEQRAGAVLASLYARRGADSLARYFLRSPGSAEEHAALAAIQLRAGDSAEAQESLARSERALASGQERGRRPRGANRGRDGRIVDDADASGAGGPGGRDDDGFGGMPDRDLILLAAVGGLALLLIIGLIVLSTRRSRTAPVVMTPPVGGPVPPPPPRRSDPAGFRVVERPAAEAPPSDAATTTGSDATDTATAADTRPPANTAAAVGTAPSAGTAATAAAPPAAAPAATPATAPATTPSAGPTGAPAAAPATAATSAHIPLPTQAGELREKIREEVWRSFATGSTIEAARRMQVSRDNIELRRMMDAASRGRSSPE